MYLKWLSSATTCINWVKNNYQLISKINSNLPTLKIQIFRLNPDKNLIEFIVQISGKNIFPKLTLNDFIKDNQLINNFSKFDQNIIHNLLQHGSINRILASTYDRDKKKFIHTIEIYDPIKNGIKYINIDILNLASLANWNFNNADLDILKTFN